jgi:hypothetical protein
MRTSLGAFALAAFAVACSDSGSDDAPDTTDTGGTTSAAGGRVEATGGRAENTGGREEATGGRATTGGRTTTTGGHQEPVAGRATARRARRNPTTAPADSQIRLFATVSTPRRATAADPGSSIPPCGAAPAPRPRSTPIRRSRS